jgi:hypothetical protein
VMCDDHGIGGIGEYCGDNNAHLDLINAFYHAENTFPTRFSSTSSPA